MYLPELPHKLTPPSPRTPLPHISRPGAGIPASGTCNQKYEPTNALIATGGYLQMQDEILQLFPHL